MLQGQIEMSPCGRKFTKPAESHYSPVEGEMLGVMEGLHKAKHFILGCEKLILTVDHNFTQYHIET